MGDKTYSIGFVSQTLDLPQSVLRYWETVFPSLRPFKTEGGTRRYTQKNIDQIRLIKDLLYTRKFTIAGARKFLNDSGEQPVVVKREGELSLSGFITRELREILALLDDKDDS